MIGDRFRYGIADRISQVSIMDRVMDVFVFDLGRKKSRFPIEIYNYATGEYWLPCPDEKTARVIYAQHKAFYEMLKSGTAGERIPFSTTHDYLNNTVIREFVPKGGGKPTYVISMKLDLPDEIKSRISADLQQSAIKWATNEAFRLTVKSGIPVTNPVKFDMEFLKKYVVLASKSDTWASQWSSRVTSWGANEPKEVKITDAEYRKAKKTEEV